MKESNQKEYNSVILAALLHDVGKLLHRITGVAEFKGAHQDLGADFVSGINEFAEDGKYKNMNFFSKFIKDDWVYKDKLEQSIRKHHSGYEPWGHIVHKADSYSTKERFEEGEGVTTYPPKGHVITLRSIFSTVCLGKDRPSEIFGYKASMLDSVESFPEEKKSKLEGDETSLLFTQFMNELQKLNFEEPDFEKFYNTLHSIFEKYLWCLPCHTHPKIADVSIFDHLKSSSSIAACLYMYHSDKNTLKVKYIKQDNEKKFLLVGGDLSGIQRYIYQISAITGEGGVAKRLRARSFYISALIETIIVKILKELNLPVSCNLMSAGGKFMILVPNLDWVKDKLKFIYKDICDWLLEEFSGELSLVMDWSTKIQGEDFYKKLSGASVEDSSGEEDAEVEEEGSPAMHRKCNFRDRIDEMYNAINNSKLLKFGVSLSDNKNWLEEKFIRTTKYASYSSGAGYCYSCNKFPAEYKDPHNEEDSEKVLCKQCVIDKVIGRKLLDAVYLAIGRDENGDRMRKLNASDPLDRDCFFFLNDNYFIQPLKTYEWKSDFIVVQRLRDHRDEKEPLSSGTVHRFLANYTPFFESYSDEENLCTLCKESRPCEQIELMKRKKDEKHLYTFSCIAAASSEHSDNSSEYKGRQLLGVLKADIDNLGLIFSEGLENKLTVSRYLTMSRMIDLFFSGWMYRILDETPEYHEIYTVYSGGDDLVVVGPWEKVIDFAQKLNHEFRSFTCNNENITLSAGIAIVAPKYPISASIEIAEEALTASKSAGKNCVTFFDTTIKWTELQRILEYKNLMHDGLNNFGDIFTTRFIHKLLHYQQMYFKAKAGDVEKLIFHSRMRYDVRRNLEEKIERFKVEEQKDWFNTKILPMMQRLYQTPIDENLNLMNNLKIPVYWTLYKNRKNKKGGES